jgi:hypothetical protein
MSAPRSCVAQFNVTTGSVPTLKATFVGTPGQDYVGPVTPLSGNGNPDWNIHLQGLRATPVKVRITSAAGGAWEDPFNGANWIILTQTDRAGNGDLWFEPWGTPGFHVKVWYADSTTDEVDAVTGVVQPTPPPSSSFQASFLGVTGEDFAGTSSVIGANGVPDWHIRLQGLRSSVVRVQITSSSGGVWESPYNGWSWLVYIREDGSGNADLFFEPWNTAAFHVKVWYSDGSTAEVDAGTGVVSPTPPPSSSFQASFLGVTGEDFAGTSSVIGANGVPDWHIRLQGLRSSVVRVQITSSSGGVWESPYNGWSWLVYVREGGSGNADLFFEPWNTAVLHVKVWYSDGSTNEVDAH